MVIMSEHHKIDFDLRGVETTYELELVERLFKTLEGKLDEIQEDTIAEITKSVQPSSEEEHGELMSQVSGFEAHGRRQTDALRSAEITRLFILFESHLKSYCRAVSSNYKLPLGYRDIQGSTTDKGRIYLCRYAGVLPENDEIWSQLDILRRVRNHLVHSGGQTRDARRKEVEQIAKKCREYDLLENGELLLSREFCDHLHKIVRQFFELAFDAIGWRTFRQIKGPDSQS